MLRVLDVILAIVHCSIVAFCLFGWLIPKLRKAHLVLVIAIAFSWFVLGAWYGWGYCFITDWEWRVKAALGEHGLPASFIKYYADKICGGNFDPRLVDTVTLCCFVLSGLLSVYFNFAGKKRRR